MSENEEEKSGDSSSSVPTVRKPRQSRSAKRKPQDKKSAAERAFPTIMRYAGLLLAMYEGVVDRPPQPIVVALASVMMAGAQVLESIVNRRGM